MFIQEQVGKVKKSYDHQQFLKSLPLGFKQFLDHISQLKYEDKPDYKVFKRINVLLEFSSSSSYHHLINFFCYCSSSLLSLIVPSSTTQLIINWYFFPWIMHAKSR